MTIYIVSKYIKGYFSSYWDNVKVFYSYEKAFNFAERIITEYCEHCGSIDFESCLENLREFNYIDNLVEIDEMEVE